MTEEEGYRFVLPARERAPATGVLLAAAGALFAIVPARVWSVLVGSLGEASVADVIGGLGVVLFTLPFAAVAVGAWLGAWRSFSSRCVVELTPAELRAIEVVGPWSRTTRRSSFELRDVVVSERPARRGTTWAVRADFEAEAPLWLGAGYPVPKLQELARNLRQAASEWSARAFEVPDDLDQLVQPARREADGGRPATDIALERGPEGLRIEVPASGPWRGSRGFFVLGLVIVLAVLAFESVAVLAGSSDGLDLRDVGPLVFLTLFLAGGLAVLGIGWNMGTRSAGLALDAEALRIERRSPFGRKSYRFERERIEDVRVADSGLEINGKAVRELQVHARGRKPLGLLSQRSEEELEWLAGELRAELTRPLPQAAPGTIEA